ncbi:MAG TPA: exodeoxyribonuclease VII large subunit [Polyangiaceae bacterium]|nr:exodeoxyribonuclease VII large subunit [Polyangiaceae bacterium]
MTNGDLSNSIPSLGVTDVAGMLEELSKQIPLPEGGLLRGEVLRTEGGGSRVFVRDLSRAMLEVRIDRPLQAERGDYVEVAGVPELVSQALPIGLRMVWRGGEAKNRGVSQRFRKRRAFVEERAAKLPFTTPRISAQLRTSGRVRVVTSPESKAWQDVEEAARKYRWMKPDPRYCENLRDPASLAQVLVSLIDVVHPDDVVLVTRSETELADLDVFEDERVVDALASLTVRCATVLAVGHTSDELMTSKVVTYPSDTASAAVHLIEVQSSRHFDPAAEEPSDDALTDAAQSRARSRERPRRAVTPPQVTPPQVTPPQVMPSQATPSSASPSSESPSRPPGSDPAPASVRGPSFALVLLLLGVAVCAGWWARGFFGLG